MMVLFIGKVLVSNVLHLGSSLITKSGSDHWWFV
jgi:hypothetical protein